MPLPESRLYKILLILLAIGLVIAFNRFGLQSYMTVEQLKSHHQQLVDYYSSHRIVVILGFIIIYVLQTALALPGAAILSIAAGAVFGTLAGTAYAVSAATIGATFAFLGSRYLFRDLVQSRFGQRFELINYELERRGLNYLLFLRLVPLFPFFLVNVAAGVTGLSLRTFLVGTCLGIIPGGFVFVNAGAGLASISTATDIFSTRVVVSLTLIGLFALLPVLYRKSRAKNSG